MLIRWHKRNLNNYRLLEILDRNWDHIRIVDLDQPEYILNDDDEIKQVCVARIGLFDDDMFYLNIPYISWFCDQEGSVHPVLRERLEWQSARWKKKRKRHKLECRRNGLDVPGVQEYYEEMDMIGVVRERLESYTRERWVQHKMASDTLLKGPFTRPLKPLQR